MKNTCSALYTKEVMRHFKKPHNYGKIKNADGIGMVGNIVCGDLMHLYIKVKNDIIKEIKFETFGCVAAISTSSVITDLAKGKTINEALKIEKDDVIRSLGALPKIKYHCSVLAVDALVEAIYDYLKKNGKPISKSLELKHQKIKKDKDIIEKRYKKWL